MPSNYVTLSVFFDGHQGDLVTVKDVAKKLKLNINSTRQLFSLFRRQGVVENVEKGLWRIKKKVLSVYYGEST